MKEKQDLYINILEMKSVQLALDVFQHWIIGESVVLLSNNAIVVAYIRKRSYCFLSCV